MQTKKKNNIHIGTSGWHYMHWKGPFYPHDLSAENFLEYYSRHFKTVEINNSFYRMPEEKTLRHWRDTSPEQFVFAVKASRYITHMKKLKDASQPLFLFLERAAALGDRLGPVLFQLPPRWRCNPERLRAFLGMLPGGHRYAFEFRDRTWFDDAVYDALQEYGAAFCIYDLAGEISPKEVTADFVYIRLHGPGGPYQGQYKTEVLAGWTGAFSAWSKQGKEIYCYFDNDEAGYAAQDALRLKEMTEHPDKW